MQQSDAEQITIITPEKDLDHQTMADATMSLQRMMQALLRKTSEKHHPSVLKDVNTIMSILLEVERVSEETARQNRALLAMLKEAIWQRDTLANQIETERTEATRAEREAIAHQMEDLFGLRNGAEVLDFLEGMEEYGIDEGWAVPLGDVLVEIDREISELKEIESEIDFEEVD